MVEGMKAVFIFSQIPSQPRVASVCVLEDEGFLSFQASTKARESHLPLLTPKGVLEPRGNC